jgi:hypothetical protein
MITTPKLSNMRHIVFLISGLLLFNCLFSQPKTKEYFLERSKKQKMTAWILLGTGAAAILTEAIVDNSQRGTGKSLTGGIMTLGGAICTLASIPFFVSSSRNKRRAMALTVNNSRIVLPGANSAFARYHSSISVHIQLYY